ncbi:MAG: nicotinate-nucleotide adenylyltransferase [Desulfobacteraceae bacterium]|nr:nicotinate-nucleotide adenylyltransferase [Desulfobacteraceae bacterium]
MKSDEFSQGRPSRLGLFGGTFNPIHRGHLRVAEDVLRHLALDQIFFIPSALPPHKSTGALAAAQDRLEMVRLALAGHAQMSVSEIEIQRTGPSYTIDTVRQFKVMSSATTEFFFIVGVDAFLEIHTWYQFKQLFEETAFAVVSRPGSGLWTGAMRRDMLDYMRRHLSDAYELTAEGDRLTHPNLPAIHLVPVTPVEIASSQIRAMVQRGQPIDPWVVPAVARHIQQRGLYR